ncbi:unnamed protein product, partial [Mesorhabditis spiculigera]
MLNKLVLSLIFGLFAPVFGTHECVELRGQLSCENDPTLHNHVQVAVMDSDALWGIEGLNDDDVMGVTYTNEKG